MTSAASISSRRTLVILSFAQDDCCPARLPDPRSRSPIPAAPRSRHTKATAPAASAATTLGPCVSTGPYAPLPRSGRPLREYRPTHQLTKWVLSYWRPLHFQKAPTTCRRRRPQPWAPRAIRPDGCHMPLCGQRPQAPTGIQPPRRLVFTAIGNTYYAYRDPSLALRMTVDGGAPRSRSQSSNLDPSRFAAVTRGRISSPIPPLRRVPLRRTSYRWLS